MNDFLITAFSSLPPGGRYMMRHSGASLFHAPWWTILISGGAAIAIVVLRIREQLKKRQAKRQSVG
jgi:hypothetical protein